LGVPPEPETEALYEAIFARKLSPPTVKKLERPIREAAVSRAIPSGGERYETGELLAEGGQSLGDVIVGVGEQRAADGLVAELTTATWGQKPVHHNLPVQRATFFGRQNELVEIQKHLLETKGRLISIIGPGGIGKTRLAITAGAELAAHFPQGVFLVPLAPLETADQILSALAEILGVQNLVADNPRLQLLNYLKRKQTLLIFDNYEHLLPQVDFVADIAATAPNVQLIVTTRERLNLGAELVYTLKGMTYPTLTDSEPEKLATYDAVQLLVGQAQMARPDVSLKPEDFKYINRICNLVQGMPLALVLAASWLDMLSFAEIAEEIANSLDFLESERGDLPPRQRSVRAVFNGSWSRLPTAAQETFARLTVFRGGFTREAARAVCKTSLRDLRVLVNSSFVTVSANGRYEVHELMRQLGAEQLAAMGTAAATNTDHSNYYLSFLHKREADLKGRRQIEALEEILEDFDNVRSAWNWALEQGNRQGIDQAQECLHLFFDIQGRYGEGRSFFSRAKETLAIPPGSKVDSIYGRILTRYAFLGIIIGRPRDMIAADLKQGLAIAIENEDRHEMAINYMAQSSLLENPPADLESFEQAKNIFEELNDDFYLSRACAALSNCYGVLLNLEKAKYYIEEAVRIARSTGSVVNLSLALGNLAEIEIAFGQYDVAQQHIQESSILGLKTHAWFLVAYCHCLSGFNRLLAGSFAEAETGGQKGLAVAEEIDHHYLKAFSLAVLSIWAGLTGQADSGKKWAEESNSITENNMMGLVLTPWGLSINYARLGRWQEASQTLAVAFKQAEDQQFPAALIWLMGTAALIAVEKGELETAVRFLSISKNHPFNATGWMAQWPRLAGLETELKQQVGEEAYETAWAEGMACEPGMLPPDILVEVSNLLDSG
jgi:predicted ATPase